MILFIIGNGFDIANGMQTGYKHFYHFLKNNHRDFFDSVKSIFLAELETDRLWRDFEECLSSFIPEYFIAQELSPLKTSESALDFHELLCLYFKKWIISIALPQNKITASFVQNAFFINFNYTDTLEEIYNVPSNNILYIHGQASNLQSRLIIGHSGKTTIDDMCESFGIVKNDNIECTKDELKYLIATEMLLFTFKKPTHDIIEEKLSLIDLRQTSEVVVLGHSLGRVDLPYFKYIKDNLLKSVHWSFSAYNDRDREQILCFVEEMQISDYSVDTIQNLILKYSDIE